MKNKKKVAAYLPQPHVPPVFAPQVELPHLPAHWPEAQLAPGQEAQSHVPPFAAPQVATPQAPLQGAVFVFSETAFPIGKAAIATMPIAISVITPNNTIFLSI